MTDNEMAYKLFIDRLRKPINQMTLKYQRIKKIIRIKWMLNNY